MTPLSRRATAEYRRATGFQRMKGERWYPDAHHLARLQAQEYGVTIEVACGVLAALSPRQGWAANVMLAERMLATGGTLDRGCLSRSLSQARAIYAGGQPLEVMRGPKTRAFYEAILTAGESPTPVIDRHAWDMLVGQRAAPSPTLGQYREACEKMQRAARILDTTVHQVQGVTWLAWRSRFWAHGINDTPKTMLTGAAAW